MTNDKPASDGGARASALPHYDVSERPVRLTVEEQHEEDIVARSKRVIAEANSFLATQQVESARLAAAVFASMAYQKPSLLRRAVNRVKRLFRYRSAVDGEFVSKKYAEANPDTTIREKAD